MGLRVLTHCSNMRAVVAVVVLGFAAAVLAQHRPDGTPPPDGTFDPDWFQYVAGMVSRNDDVLDRYHEFRFEYHHRNNRTHTVIAIGDTRTHRECHFIEVDPVWEPLLNDQTIAAAIVEEIYAVIDAGTVPETQLTVTQLDAAYGDHDATKECIGYMIKVLHYTPSATIQAMKPSA